MVIILRREISLALILAASFLGCSARSHVKVDAVDIEELSTANSFTFIYSTKEPDPMDTMRAKAVAGACAKELTSKGYQVNPTVAADPKDLKYLPKQNEVTVWVYANVLGGENYDSGSTTRCAVVGGTAVCRDQKNSLILYKKLIALYFTKRDGNEFRQAHRLTALALTPTEKLSGKTASEMCKAAFTNFPNGLDSEFVATQMGPDD